ncbi:hypothetical protein [Sphaerisporangium sp. NPDC051011]|uniref:hypothetical protein n=1 Tax=Sphaerisporangium sp. NPDC051011 TaxID=3155792 RepID=UPI0033C7354C
MLETLLPSGLPVRPERLSQPDCVAGQRGEVGEGEFAQPPVAQHAARLGRAGVEAAGRLGP